MHTVIDGWSGLRVAEPVAGGARNDVWMGVYDGAPVAVRRSRRDPASLAWELEVLQTLGARRFGVAPIVETDRGTLSHGGIVVQRWVDGRPPASEHDWTQVAGELQRLHEACGDVAQRPGCVTVAELGPGATSVDADLGALPHDVESLVLQVFASFADVPASLVHGDPGPSNIRIDGDDRVWFLDWDESRVDLTWHDLSNLGVQVLDDDDHQRALILSDAWETANGWVAEPGYAHRRLASLRRRLETI